MPRVVIVGGGFSGCAAAVTAAKMGVETVLVEKSDYLLGVGNMAGICDINGERVGVMECEEMGAGEVFEVSRNAVKYHNVPIPHLEGSILYDLFKAEQNMRRLLDRLNVEVRFNTRATNVIWGDGKLAAIRLGRNEVLEADAFVDATGGAGPEAMCRKHGRGCTLCLLRCPVYGPRVSITEKAGVKEGQARQRGGGIGSMSNACVLIPGSLSPEILDRIKAGGGVALIPAPDALGDREYFRKIRTQQYLSRPEYEDNLVCVDTGMVKVMSRPWINLDALRRVKGFERAAFFDPLVGTRGNGVRFLAVAPHDNRLQVTGVPNLFCAGEKLLLVGVDTVTVSGLLAGHNAARHALSIPPIELPRRTAVGESLAWINERLQTEEGWYHKYSMQGTGGVWDRLKEKGLYTTEREVVAGRIAELGLAGIFNKAS
ncbi:MAG: FAD-dependent oxidoreductase [Firmicutes bacterium]|nr:FAD-dependent oxidoreductase [Bacillota bacterium]